MEAWNETIKAALLGTERNALSDSSLPDAVKETFTRLQVNETDREEKFLKAAALIMNYSRAGGNTSSLPSAAHSKAEPDTRAACSRKAADLFATTVSEGRRELTAFWVHTCNSENKRVPHWLLPQLLDIGGPHTEIQHEVAKIADARGQWLAKLNREWAYILPVNFDEIWSTGKPTERYLTMQYRRKIDPAKAREVMASTWKQENANVRTDLIRLLAINLSREDAPFLEEQLNDKSQKVKAEAKYLLRLIPGSSVYDLTWEKLKASIDIKKPKLIGNAEIILKKLSTEYKEMLSGAEKDSDTTVSLKDDERWYFHMISAIEPSDWERHFGLSPKKIVSLFKDTKKAQKYLPAFALAAHRRNNIEWAKVLLDTKITANSILLLKMLPLNEREKTYKELMEDDISVVNAAFEDHPYHQWSHEFTRHVLKHASSDAYRFRKEWYRTTTIHFHTDIILELDKYGPKDLAMKSFWQGITQEIVQTIELREAIKHSLK